MARKIHRRITEGEMGNMRQILHNTQKHRPLHPTNHSTMRFRCGIFLLLMYQCALHGQPVHFSQPSGFYLDSLLLQLTTETPYPIRFSLDGSDPTASSPVFTGPIWLHDRSPQPNGIAGVPTNPANTAADYRWRPPQGQVPKSVVVRAALFEGSEQVGDVVAAEYFIGTGLDSIGLPVVSIWADSAGLFGYEQGIYVPGKDYDDNPFIWQPGNYYNEGPEWEREAIFSYYDGKDLALQQPFELKMHGGGSRLLPCKSLRLSAKEGLGAGHFEYPFFPERSHEAHKRLVLRNGGQDFSRTLMADVLMQSLLAPTGLEYQSARQVVVFINGVYWGIHNLTERYDKHYLRHYHDGDLEAIDHFEIAMDYWPNEGSSADFEALIALLPFSDLSDPAQYADVAQQLDLQNFIDHHISKVYGGGDDWSGNNEEIWRPQRPDARWRWLVNDYDDAFVNFEKNSYGHATRTDGVNWPNPEWSTRLFRSLMQNPGFAKQYKQSLRKHLDTTYHPARVQRAIDSLATRYRLEMGRHIRRWGHPASLAQWEANIAQFKVFAAQRAERVWHNFKDYFPDIYLPPSEVSVRPNPVGEVLWVDLPDGLVGKADFRVFNASGQLVQYGVWTNEQANELVVTDWPTGLYVLEIVAEEFAFRQRVVKR
ncbi:MAG: CotH kinase family protein [Saprospiraceae bacterium]|nr:CotH kinase family protein [Saprospiraceae bacterium]